MRLATGNDLVTGDVVWWNGADWSRNVGEAVDVSQDGEAIVAREEAARRVNVPYLIEATPGADGPRPAHIKDRIRAYGPTVQFLPDTGRGTARSVVEGALHERPAPPLVSSTAAGRI